MIAYYFKKLIRFFKSLWQNTKMNKWPVNNGAGTSRLDRTKQKLESLFFKK